ncbi:putative endoglucanase E1 [Acephala macrosclerotiorum]|nr:putative endoglucanase E1 [Acephala macrosclerotiorum]
MRFGLPGLVVLALGVVGGQCAFPNGPFVTSGRWIHNSLGNNVTYAGVNWPGAADVMIPEGLQYASIASIVSGIKSLGMNVIRLTFAIEMIDDIYNGGDVTLATAFNTALGTTNGPIVYQKVLENNPQFSASTTRLQVYDAIAAECLEQEIYVHLDNHISKGEWCCSTTDGNAWFGDTYFNVANWKRGLQYMVTHGKSWGNLMSIGMRNELRTPSDNTTLANDYYNWPNWYTNMVAASAIINTANPDILIFFSGLSFDTTLTPIVAGTNLGSNIYFNETSFPYWNKMVLELHDYENSVSSCSTLQSDLVGNGFSTLSGTQTNTMPMVLTEWGHDQTDGSYTGVYASCLHSYLPSVHAGWMIWVLAGSYYIRSGTQDYDETWGLYNHNWTAWRSPAAVANLETMVSATLAS